MDHNQLEHFKELLLKEKKDITATLERMEENEPNTSLREYYDELSAYDNHPADIGSETYEMEMNFNLKNNEHLRLIDVEKALKRLDKGTYGKCITCGESIDLDRLEILPTAYQCMECENQGLSVQYETNTRPVEEELLDLPYGRSFKSHNEVNGFDGEDAWQEVAKFNKTDPHNMALDWYDNNMYDEEEKVSGAVENVENYSNEYYIGQLQDERRLDIPVNKKNKKRDKL